MNKYIVLLLVLLTVSCSKKIGASDRAMSVIENRFSLCHLKDSLRESEITYLWSEYDSEFNSILCFQYGGCAIEYFYHDNENAAKRDTFIIKNGEPFVDDLRDSYKKFTDNSYISSRLDKEYYSLLNSEINGNGSFIEYFKECFPTEESFIENMINQLANNEF